MTDRDANKILEKKYPKVTTGVVIINREGKFFFMRHATRFNQQLHIPGGHVEWGETLESCVKREVLEETGLTIYNPEFIRPVEFVLSPDYDETRHIIPLDFAVHTDDPENAVRLDQREGVEYVWLSPDEIVKRDDIEPITKETIQIYFQKQQKDKECSDYKLGWQRAVADYQNLQKETAARRSEWASLSEQTILEEFIPVYDNFKKAFGSKQTTDNRQQESWVQGIEYIKKQFRDILKNYGVEEIKTVGERFDPVRHESVGDEEAEGKEPGTILREADGGYMMKNRIIKVARVIIAKS